MKPGDILYVNNVNGSVNPTARHRWLFGHHKVGNEILAVSQTLILIGTTCLIIIPELQMQMAATAEVCKFAYIYAGGLIGMLPQDHLSKL